MQQARFRVGGGGAGRGLDKRGEPSPLRDRHPPAPACPARRPAGRRPTPAARRRATAARGVGVTPRSSSCRRTSDRSAAAGDDNARLRRTVIASRAPSASARRVAPDVARVALEQALQPALGPADAHRREAMPPPPPVANLVARPAEHQRLAIARTCAERRGSTRIRRRRPRYGVAVMMTIRRGDGGRRRPAPRDGRSARLAPCASSATRRSHVTPASERCDVRPLEKINRPEVDRRARPTG